MALIKLATERVEIDGHEETMIMVHLHQQKQTYSFTPEEFGDLVALLEALSAYYGSDFHVSA